MKDHKAVSERLDFEEGTPEEFVAAFQKDIQSLRDKGWVNLKVVFEEDYDWSHWKIEAQRPMTSYELGQAKAARTRAAKKKEAKALKELEEKRQQYENLKTFFEERQ